MATFARSTFNVAAYEAFRPTYPLKLFQTVYAYHAQGGGWKKAVDVGCGTGQVTTVLSETFEKVIGVDPSEKMINQAKISSDKIRFVTSPAEDLHFLSDGSVDLITAGQAAHWFNFDKFWNEAGRVLRGGGSVALWGYSEFRLRDFLSTTPLITAYSQGNSPYSVGPYWQQPGRSILDNHYLDIPPAPRSLFTSHQHIKFTGRYFPEFSDEEEEVILGMRMTWEMMESYLRTWSSLHKYLEVNPGGGEDLCTRFLKELRGAVESEVGEVVEDVHVEWPVTMILAKKRIA